MVTFRTLAFTLLIALTGCSNQTGLFGYGTDLGTATAPQRSADIKGTLTKIDTSPSGGILLIEASPGVAGGARAAVKLTPASILMRQDGHRISFADLQTNQPVQAWYAGPAAASDPPQAPADTVMLLQ